MIKKLTAIIFCAVLTGLQTAPVFACAIAIHGEDGKSSFVEIQREDVLIVWDESTKTEHFIRRIDFGQTERDFGFIVPLPNVPEVANADASVFDRLEKKISPVRIILPDTFWILGWIHNIFSLRIIYGAASEMGSAPDMPHSMVRLLQTGAVAGQEYSVLQADNAAALTSWLKDHQYRMRPDMGSWLKKYIDAKWTFAAFKYNPSDPRSPLTTKAIRLSFKTDRAFFPYREPQDQQDGATGIPRLLKIYFIGPKRIAGQIGEGQLPWPGVETYANLTFSASKLLEGAIPKINLGAISWLTVFEDRSSPRPAKDELYFSDRGSIIPKIPTEIVWVPIIPDEFLFLLMFSIIPLLRWRKRKRAR
jgi:hypothetical protein